VEPALTGAIVKTCGSRSLSCLGMSILAGPFDELAVDEGCSGADQGDQVGCVDGTPAVLGGFDELERHGQARCPRAGALGDLGAVAHGGEGGLDRYLEFENGSWLWPGRMRRGRCRRRIRPAVA